MSIKQNAGAVPGTTDQADDTFASPLFPIGAGINPADPFGLLGPGIDWPAISGAPASTTLPGLNDGVATPPVTGGESTTGTTVSQMETQSAPITVSAAPLPILTSDYFSVDDGAVSSMYVAPELFATILPADTAVSVDLLPLPIVQSVPLTVSAAALPVLTSDDFYMDDGADTTMAVDTDVSDNLLPVTITTQSIPGPVGSQGSLLLVAGLASATAPVLGASSTSIDAIAGRAIDTAAIVSLMVSVDGGTAVNETSDIGSGGAFTLTPALLNTIAGSTLANGAHTVVVSATDASDNTTSAGVSFTLDNVAPTLNAGLADITGTTTLAQTMGATTNDTVDGTGTDSAGVISLYGTLDGVAKYTNLTGDIGTSGAFTLTPSVLDTLAGEVVPDGQHSLVLQATDTAGNVTTQTVKFDLETVLGVPTLAIASADQTTSPTTTNASAITLLGTTTPEATVTLTNNGATATAGETGLFQFTNVPVATGGNALAVQVTNLAGITQKATLNVTQTNAGGTDPVIEWITTTRQAITTDASPPTVASRALAIESLSVYNAVSAIDGTPGYDSTLVAPSGANAQAAVISAAQTALDTLYPAQVATFNTQAAAELVAIPDGLGKTEGIAVGQEAANAELASRANDGSANNSITDIGSDAPGAWQPTAPSYSPGLDPQWASVTPFAMTSTSQFLPAAPPAIGTAAYAAAVNETFSLGELNSTSRTPAETQLALFFNDQTGTDSPAGQWNQIAATVAQSNGDGLSQDALLFAELNVAEADSAIAAWNGKYTYNTWRPITIFTDPTIASVNPAIDSSSTWEPLLATPNFPEYPEGHGTFSDAAAAILSSFFGNSTTFTATSQSDPGVTLTFDSFSSAADDAAMSRVYGGIHFSFSETAALALGTQIGDWTLGVFNSGADTTPPVVTLSTPTAGVTNQDPTISGTVSSSFGVASLDAIINNGSSVIVPLAADGSFSFTDPVALNGSADGEQNVSFIAIDPAGNQSATVNYTFDLFTEQPAITLATGSVTNNATIGAGAQLEGSIGLEAGDTVTSLSYSYDNGAPISVVVSPTGNTFGQALYLTSLTPGAHLLTLTAVDAAGNSKTQVLNVVYALPPLTLTSITPTAGTSNEGVTFRPSITFSRAVDVSTLTSTDFYATDSSGAVLPATVVPFSDGTGAWLLPTGTWPGASAVTLNVVGQDIKAAADGAELDAAGIGTPGSTLTDTFTTVSSAPVPGTTITGFIVDPGPDNTPFTPDDVKSSVGNSTDYASDTWKLPIAGATVYVLGDEQDAVKTAANGSFTLTNVPAGDVKVVVDGTTATNPPAGYFFPAMTLDITVKAGVSNYVAADMGSPQEQAGMAADPAVYLPRVASDSLTPLSTTVPTVITAPANADLGSGAFTLTTQQLSELSLTVQPNSVIDANGNLVPNAEVGIAPVPASIVQDMLPAGLMQHSYDITIQAPGGSVFTAGATLTMPNVFGLAPGEQTYILSFDHTTGKLVIDGTATASADGKTVTTDANTAIMAPGWHGMTPPGSNGNGMVGDPNNPSNALFPGFIHAFDALTNLAGTVFTGIGTVATVLGADGGPAIPVLNVLGTASDGLSLGADLSSGASGSQIAYDVVKLGLDAAGFVPGPVGIVAGIIRFGIGAWEISNTNAPTVINDVTASPQPHQQLISGAQSVSDAMDAVSAAAAAVLGADSSAYTSLLATLVADQQEIATEAAYQIPILTQMASDADVADALHPIIDPTKPNDGLTATQLTSLKTAAADMVTQAALLTGHPTVWGLIDKFISDAQAVLNNITTTNFTAIEPPRPVIEYALAAAGQETTTSIAGSAATTDNAASSATVGTTSQEAVAEAFPVADISTAGPSLADARATTTMYAAVQAPDGSVQRLSFEAGQGYDFFFAPNTQYTVTVFDPTTNSIGYASFESAASGQNTQIPLVGLVTDTSTPGADGLTATEAFVIGVSNATASNLVPGITDLSALQQGLYNGSVLPGTTGIVASLPLMGSAQSVVIAGSLTGGMTAYAYVATGSYGLAVVDVSNPDQPLVLGQISLGGNATGVAVSTTLGIAAVANGSSLTFVNISNPSALSVIDSVGVPATQVQIIGGLAYAAVGTQLDSFDVATGTLLQDLSLGGGNITGIAASGATLYTMDASDNLRVIDTSTGEMVLDGSVTLPNGGNGLVVGPNNVVYVAAGNSTATGDYVTVDVSNPSTPKLIAGVANGGLAGAAIALNGSGIGLTVQAIQEPPPNAGVHDVVDLLNTSDPTKTAQFETRFALPAQPYGVAIGAGTGFIADGTSGLQVVNYLAPDTTGVPPVIDSISGPADVDPDTAGTQVYEGVPVSLDATVSSNVQVRNVELLLIANGATSVVANTVTSPFAMTATMPTIASLGTNTVSLEVDAIDTGGNVTISAPIQVELVPDTRPLDLLFQTVGEGAILSQFDHILSFTFSKPLLPSSVTASDFEVVNAGGTVVTPASLELTGGNQVVQLDYGTLAAGSYKLEVDAPDISDVNGIALGGSLLTTDFTVQEFSSIFTNAAGGSWNTASNWNTGVVPGATDSAFIGNAIGAAVDYDGNTDTVAELVASGSGQFDVTGGQLIVSGLLEADELIATQGGGLAAEGSVSVNGLGQIQVDNRNTSLNNVTIAAGGQIQISNNSFLYIAGTVANAGTISLNSGGNDTELDPSGNMTLSGGGVVRLTDNGNNYIDGDSAPVTLTNAGNTIEGAGTIGGNGSLTLDNLAGGTIDATGATTSLFLSTDTIANSGLLEATGPAGLVIRSSGVTNTGGTIAAPVAGSVVDLQSASIVGGTLTDANGGVIQTIDRFSSIDNVTLGSGDNLHIVNNTFLTVADTLTNRGTVYMDSNGNFTLLQPTGTATLTGGGSIQLSDNSNNYIYDNTVAATLINVNNTILGAGTIGAGGTLTLLNQAAGTIEATGTNNGLVLLTATVTNTGLLEGTGPAPLVISSSSVANVGGTIAAPAAGSVVDLQTATIVGGTLTDANGGVIQSVDRGSTIDNVTLTAGANAHVTNNNFLTVAGTLTNDGTVYLDSNGNFTLLEPTATTTLTGGGAIQLTDNSNNYIYDSNTPTTLININNTIRGGGTIGAGGGLTLNNQAKGVIDATGATNALVLASTTVNNAGTLEGTGAAPLQILSTTVNNTGVIAAPDAASVVNLQSATIDGGTLTDANGGVIETADRFSTIDNVTLTAGGDFHVTNNNFITVADTLTNHGTVYLDSNGNFTLLQPTGTTTLTGGGAIQLSDNGNNYIFDNSTATTLINVNNTIRGAGTIGTGGVLTLDNQTGGTIAATGTNNALVLFSATVNNAGTIEANGPAPLTINSTAINNTGTIEAAAAGDVIDLQSASITGGELLATNGGVIQAIDRGSVLTNVNVQVGSGGDLLIPNDQYLYLQGTLTNQGTVSLGSTGNDTRLIAIGGVTLTGNGQVVLSDNPNNTLVSNGTAATFININNTISGAGQIGDQTDPLLTLTNAAKGIIDANGGNVLSIALSGGTLTNTGLIEATSTAINNNGLSIDNTVIDNTGGNNAGVVASFGANSHVNLQSATILGGTLKTTGGGVIQATDRGSELENVTISQSSFVDVPNNQYLYFTGTIVNNGSVTVASGGNDTRLNALGAATLTGTGSVQLTDNINNVIGGGAGATLTNLSNKIEGSGTIGDGNLSFTNAASGIVDATGTGSRLLIAGGVTVTNAGLIEDTGAAGLALISTTINNTGTIAAPLGGSHIDLQSATINGGVLTTADGGYFQAVDRGSTLNGVTIAAGAVVAVDNDQYLYLQNTVSNRGTIEVNSGGNDTRLNAIGGVTLTGGGLIQLSDNANNTIGGTTLTNVNNTLAGSGSIGDGSLSFDNQTSGTVDATGTASRLAITGGVPVTNAGIIEDTGSAGLLIVSTAINNTGTIEASVANAHVDLQSASINGGVLSTANGGYFQAVDRGTTLNGVTIASGLVAVVNDDWVYLAGDVTNHGTIQVNSGGNDTRLMINPGVTLGGGGIVQLSNNINNSIYSNGANTTFTDDSTIEGAGNIGDANMTLTVGAAGTIDANVSNGLVLNTASDTVINAGLLQSSGSGGLSVTGGGGVANSGTIWADGDGLYVEGSVSGAGSERITGAATLRVGGTVAAGQTVGFDTGATGTLRLDDSQQFSGTVADLAKNGGNALDLSDIQFINTATTTATFNNGTLTVTDGTHVANIALAGNYSGQTFITSSDGHNGTTVIDPPLAASGGEGLFGNVSVAPADLLPDYQSPGGSPSAGFTISSSAGVAFGALTTEAVGAIPKAGWLAG